MTAIIQVTNVSKQFAQKSILSHINFDVAPGEIIGLIGKNGAGKSTLINMMLGLTEPTDRKITLFGQAPQSKTIKDKIGVMFQDSFGLDRVRGSELIQLVRSYYSHPLPFSEVVKLAALGENLTTMVTKMSEGQRRKLNFALAMAGNPELLFLDEPTAGMNANSRYDFWQQIQQLSQAGKTIIVTSHYLEEIEDVASRIIFLKDHHVLYDGPLAGLQKSFTHTIVEFDSSLPEAQIAALIHNGDLDSHNQSHYVFVTEDADAVVRELTPEIANVRNLRITQQSLDQIFREVIKEGD